MELPCNKTLRAGVIGVGKMGYYHTQKYLFLQKILPVKLVGVWDQSPERVAKIRNEFKNQGIELPMFASFSDFLESLDLVTIATPAETHFDLAQHCLKLDKHVLVEKPMALSREKGKTLVDLTVSREKVLGVGFSERYQSLWDVFGPLVGELGRIKTIMSAREAPSDGRIQDVDVLDDLLVHDLDLVQYLFAPKTFEWLKPLSISFGEKPADTFWGAAKISIKSQKEPIFWQVRVSRRACSLQRIWEIQGEDGTIVFDLQQSAWKLRWFETQRESEWVTKNPQFKTNEWITLPKNDHLLLETQDFIRLILDRNLFDHWRQTHLGLDSGLHKFPRLASAFEGMQVIEWVGDAR